MSSAHLVQTHLLFLMKQKCQKLSEPFLKCNQILCGRLHGRWTLCVSYKDVILTVSLVLIGGKKALLVICCKLKMASSLAYSHLTRCASCADVTRCRRLRRLTPDQWYRSGSTRQSEPGSYQRDRLLTWTSRQCGDALGSNKTMMINELYCRF